MNTDEIKDEFEDEVETTLPEDDHGDDSLQIEYEDDLPDAPTFDDDPTEEELEAQTAGVKKRINKLAMSRAKERQDREAAEQRERAAIEYARSIMTDNEKLKAELAKQQESSTTYAKQSVEAQVAAAQREYRSAYDEGDADAMVNAQTKLARLQAEAYQMEREAASRPAAQPAQPQQYQQPQRYQQYQQYPQYQQYQQPQQPQVSPRLQAWLDANDSWFQKDRIMTGTAMGIHEQLIEEGVEPDSKEYYTALNSELQKQFPERFSATDKRKSRAPVVAPATRSGKTPSRRVVKLTASERALAKSLGVSEERYAEQKYLKEQANG